MANLDRLTKAVAKLNDWYGGMPMLKLPSYEDEQVAFFRVEWRCLNACNTGNPAVPKDVPSKERREQCIETVIAVHEALVELGE